MINPGVYNLGAVALTVALTDEVITEGVSAAGVDQAFIDRLEGMLAGTLTAKFAYGSGGTSCSVIVQTRLGADGDWIDVARFDFAQTSATRVANLSGLLSKAVASVAALGAEGVNDGVIGIHWRAKITSVGTYAGTNVSVRLGAR